MSYLYACTHTQCFVLYFSKLKWNQVLYTLKVRFLHWMQVLWRLISCVNWNRPWGAQTLGPAWFWECLWGCFWMKLTLNWWTLQSEWLCPVWVGLVQPFEGLNRTNRWQKRRLLLSDCELGHQSLDLDWNIGSPGSSVCWLRCTYVCVLVLSLKKPNTDVFLCQWMRTPCILSVTSPCMSWDLSDSPTGSWVCWQFFAAMNILVSLL